MESPKTAEGRSQKKLESFADLNQHDNPRSSFP